MDMSSWYQELFNFIDNFRNASGNLEALILQEIQYPLLGKSIYYFQI